jgi:hypothetical protein
MYLGLVFALLTPAAAAADQCPELQMTENDLVEILDTALGGLRNFVSERTVRISPQKPGCYIEMSLTVAGSGCQLTACSVVVVDQQRIGLNAFRVNGCDPLFSLINAPRDVPTAYADARSRIQKHCGDATFKIARASPGETRQGARVRVEFEKLR